MNVSQVDRALELARARGLAKSGLGKTIRLAARLSLRDVASACDASPSAVLRWEVGQRVPHGPSGIRWMRFIDQLSERAGQ